MLRSLNNQDGCRRPNITNSLIRYFFIVCQINEHNKCLLSSNYSSEKRYKEKRMGRAEGTTTKAILLRTTSRDGAYIKVIVIRQTEYKDSPGKRPVIHVTDSLYYHTIILYWGNTTWILVSLRVLLMEKRSSYKHLKQNTNRVCGFVAALHKNPYFIWYEYHLLWNCVDSYISRTFVLM